jgi:hypothetical protein
LPLRKARLIPRGVALSVELDPLKAIIMVGGGGTLASIVCFLDRNETKFRCRGVASHVALWVFAAVPMLAAPLVARATRAPAEDFAIPVIAFLLAAVGIHFVVPAAAQDFTSSSLGASVMLALVMVAPTILYSLGTAGLG